MFDFDIAEDCQITRDAIARPSNAPARGAREPAGKYRTSPENG